MKRKTMALAGSKSAQIATLLDSGLETKEIVAKGFSPQLVYQVKSKKNGRANGHAKKSGPRPISLIVGGVEVTIANGTPEQVGKIAAVLSA